MIRGKYMTSIDDTSEIINLRMRISGYGADERDNMAIYAIAFDYDGNALGCGRLSIVDDSFTIDSVCVLDSSLSSQVTDLIARMLILRALDLNAPEIFIETEVPMFYSAYGFCTTSDKKAYAKSEDIILDSCSICNKCSKN